MGFDDGCCGAAMKITQISDARECVKQWNGHLAVGFMDRERRAGIVVGARNKDRLQVGKRAFSLYF